MQAPTNSPILIYLPTVKALTPDLTQEHNLADLIPLRSSREVGNGPAGGGIIVAARDTPLDLMTYCADRQRWTRRFGCSSYVGTWTDRPQPTPGDLLKPNRLEGPLVRLLDGNDWQIPLLRTWNDDEIVTYNIRLPRMLEQDPDTGRFYESSVVPRYSALFDRSVQIFQGFRGAIEVSDQVATEFAMELLAVNHYLDSSVISHLGLTTMDHCVEILKAALDMATFEGLIKNRLSRSASSGTSSDSGN